MPPELAKDDDGHDAAALHDPVYDAMAASPEFAELRRRYRAFVFPATLAFLAWFALYVGMSNWAKGFMSQQLVGNINVALVFGLLQFATTFLIAWLYARYSSQKLDPLAEELEEHFITNRAGVAAGGER